MKSSAWYTCAVCGKTIMLEYDSMKEENKLLSAKNWTYVKGKGYLCDKDQKV